ncbi:MAG TPA: chalcone isomerase family protein [Gemmataceae bacterium]|nr:chalcone isomerase family protein [Gemmataceae bacterium]
MKTLSRLLLGAAVAVLCGTAALGEAVGVDGSSTTYETKIEITVADKAVKMDLTGAALRKRVIFKVYTIGSYVEAGAGVGSAEDLAAADCPKQLHLVMERDVEGKEMAEAVEKAIHKGRGDDAFPDELKKMAETMKGLELKKGDHIYLTNIPKKGLECNVVDKKQVTIENSDFSKAIWEIYLGKKNIDDDLKKALVSRL